MCGIVGIIAKDSKQYSESLKRMITALSHRGPDASGDYYFDECALGHSRLSIVDLSGGQQPMLSPLSPLGITFNGEIYGFQKLRKNLSHFPFQTHSDTEVILALYEKYHDKMISHLPGMFAFAIWDNQNKELFCARDRFGEKPFYYAFGKKGEFVFASEIKAIISSGLIRPKLNLNAISYYLRYLYVHSSMTIYQNIYTLPPAHTLKYNNGKLLIGRYWDLPKTQNGIELTDALLKFKELFEKAVSQQLVADVEVGAFLSGGLDSSTVVAVASQYKNKLKTFSFGFDNTINELPFAREIAKLYHTEHLELRDSDFNSADLLMEMQSVYDEPFADSSNIPTFIISKMAKQHIKVVLSGDGADELLAGYSYWYQPLLGINKKNDISLFSFSRILNKIFYPAYNSISQAHTNQKMYFSRQEISSLLLALTEREFNPELDNFSDTLDDALRMDILDYLPGDILVKLDRASMANGLELRTPFLEIDFASFCISLPFNLKINRKQDKILLREAYAHTWTDSIRKREKQGFGGPVNQWLRRKSVKALKEKYLNNSSQKIFSLLSFAKTRKYLQRDNYQTWILLVLALWMEYHEFEF